MTTHPMFEELKAWHDFFLLAGGASATLLGLVFVSLALVANLAELPQDEDLFASPIRMQFTCALGLSAVCLVPWQSTRLFGGLIALLGTAAVTQPLVRIPRLRRFQRRTQHASASLWLNIVLVPLVADVLSITSGVLIWQGESRAFGGVAAAVLLLVLIGLRNAWNLTVWIVEQHHHRSKS